MTDEKPPRRVLASTVGPEHDPQSLARMARAKEDVDGIGVTRILDERAIRKQTSRWRRLRTWLRMTWALLVPAGRSR